MGYFLLTGGTGLLGRYLLRDLMLADLPLAVVVRPTKWESAAQRIETALARWEQQLNRSLPRPVVLEGDISEPCLGLGTRDLDWVGRSCQAMIHSAASLTFHADEPTGEPWRSNVQGTRNVIELCRRANVRRLHHVSTAYVCGSRRGRILETELDVGQTPGNDYERTKLMAEKEVLSADVFDQVTVYRPSIIVGDSRTGFTTSYHGFYTPLRVVYSLLQSVPWEQILQSDWLGRLELAGDEHKNLVCVDWVSAAMTWLVAHPECHGRTYHLTNPTPVTALSMQEVFARVLGEIVLARPPRMRSLVNEDYLAAFQEQMTIYRSYWSDDPDFDSAQTEAALPHLPCPQIDQAVMDRLVRFAIETNFGWPREAAIVAPYDAQAVMDRFCQTQPAVPATAAPARLLNMCVAGPGGGQWNLAVAGSAIVAGGRGTLSEAKTACYLNSKTFEALTRAELTLGEALASGRLVIAGNSMEPSEIGRILRHLASDDETRTLANATLSED